MTNTKIPPLVTPQKANDQSLFFEHYKIIITSLDKINEIRELSNNFWITLNVLLIGTIAYVRDAHCVALAHKPYFALTIILIGLVMSASWVNYLATIKKSVDIRNKMLIELEADLPVKFITVAVGKIDQKLGGSSLSHKEMVVPALFCIGYVGFAILIYAYPKILAP